MPVVETVSSFKDPPRRWDKDFVVDNHFEARRDITLRLTNSVAVPNSGKDWQSTGR
jgi:hypothetical protein